VDPIFEAVLANDPSRIEAGPSDAAAQRMEDDLFVAELPHQLYRGDTPLHHLQLEIVRLLLAAGATLADTDRNGVAAADRIQSRALRQALAAGQP
jgi:hypothetical protein